VGRSLRRAGVLAIAFGVGCSPKRVAHIVDPTTARRFEIITATDTTFRFVAHDVKWVRVGQVGIAVDPRRRDALVARYVVQSLAGDTATALVTGQATDVASIHVALLQPPRRGTLKQGAFWAGFFGGGALAAAAAILAR
jgi:hypothetical protein